MSLRSCELLASVCPCDDIMPMPFGGSPEAPAHKNLENNPMQSGMGVLF
jgi:hypothetical protein